MSNQIVPFIEFSQSDYELRDPDDDILGFALYDKDGAHLGHIKELLLDNSGPAKQDQPQTRRVALAVAVIGEGTGERTVMIPFEVLQEADQTRREVRVSYPREYFEHGDLEFRGLNYLDRDATGRLYGFYDMNPDWFDERRGADPEGVKYG